MPTGRGDVKFDLRPMARDKRQADKRKEVRLAAGKADGQERAQVDCECRIADIYGVQVKKCMDEWDSRR